MSISPTASIIRYGVWPRRRAFARITTTVVGALFLLLASAGVAVTQSAAPKENTWEFRVSSGALIATGSQRDVLKDAQATTTQLSRVVHPSLAITGTFGWARSRDLTSVTHHKLDVFTSDLGVEFRRAERARDDAITFHPFVGLGAGVRSYNYRKLDVDATHNVAGYGAVGGELGVGRVGLRAEVRNYVAGFKPLVGGGKADTRNDIVMMFSVRFNRARSSQD